MQAAEKDWNPMGIPQLEDYWLCRSAEDVVKHLDSLQTSWVLWGVDSIRDSWVRNFCAYYSALIAPTYMNSSMVFMGEQGELVQFYTPIAKTYIRQLVSIVTKQRLAFTAMAQSSGNSIIADVKLANALSDQVVETERCNNKGDTLAEMGLVLGGGFLETCWDTSKGHQIINDENGKPIASGSASINVVSPFDCFYNRFIPNWEDQTCVVVRCIKNRWDLIAEYPHLADKIAALPSYGDRGTNFLWMGTINIDRDMVYCYRLYVKPSPALPEGRMMYYSDQYTVYMDEINYYGCIPVEPMIPEPLMTLGIGYPKLTDLLACQEIFDTTLSSIGTNMSQFAVQSVAIARGSNVDVNQLNGMRFVSFTPQDVPGGGMPQPLQLSATAPETFKFAEIISAYMQQMSMLNGALTGDLPSGVSSGTAIATLSANALEFISSFSKAYNLCWEKTFMHVMNCYKNFAMNPQMVNMQGRNGNISTKQFVGSDLKNITGMKIQTSNPLMQSIAGRLEIGEKLLSTPRDIWPQYCSIIEGRPLDQVYRGDVSEMDLVYMENEELREGRQVLVASTDDHALHIIEHKGLIADPKVRMNGEHVDLIMEHILMHEQEAQQMMMNNPMLLAILKTGKMPEGGQMPMGPMPPPTGGPGAPSQALAQASSGTPKAVQEDRLGADKQLNPAVADVAEPAQDLLGRGI